MTTKNYLEDYLENLNRLYKSGNATEHTFRGDLQRLIENLAPDVLATNEPKRQKCGAPDYILTKKDNDIPIGYIEAKNIGDKDLEGQNKTGNKEQFDRYKEALQNLIFTDYLNFYFYEGQEFSEKISIAKISENGLVFRPENFATFENLIKNFCANAGQNIANSEKLVSLMAAKTRLLASLMANALIEDEKNSVPSELKAQLKAFRKKLIYDIQPKEFADIYAQTITYGLFAARVQNSTKYFFTRKDAAELIPKANPFLRRFFGYIAGPEIDDRIKWIVDNLAEIFQACDINKLLENYGKSTQTEDPIIHFYENFLAAYDPKTRKEKGVWYTPAPIVNFIVRAVDHILQTDFKLPQGLADTAKITVKIKEEKKDTEREVHRVQILDPAAGTGTFLAEVIKIIHKKFSGQQGIWSGYVEKNLLPRLNGFELLMASYAMAHLNVDLMLKQTGFAPTKSRERSEKERTKIYLTNSLEKYHRDSEELAFAEWLNNESKAADYIKRDAPIMCVMGNPPYSGESANKNEWIMKQMEAYKKEPGGTDKLQEKNSKWLNDDYVKFIRCGQRFIEKKGSGILAFINPHGYLDNPTFRGMRWHLLHTYDKIYTIDLHGNSKKKETADDGSKDENVFDITQGVSINIFVKTGQKPAGELGQVFHFDLYGRRESKFNFLLKNNLDSVNFLKLENIAPNYFFVPKDFTAQKKYDEGFSLAKLFTLNSVGIVTARDSFVIDEKKNILENRIRNFFDSTREELITKYDLKENKSWKINDIKLKNKSLNKKSFQDISYRPFDKRFVYYEDDFVERNRREVMQHFLTGENIGLVSIRRSRKSENWNEIFVTNKIISGATTISALDINYVFPLYRYEKILGGETEKKANLDSAIVAKIAAGLGLVFAATWDIPDNLATAKESFAPLDVLDYVYAVLHSPGYREKYREFLKIDFPKVPYPKEKNIFWRLVKLGGELRKIHLLEAPVLENFITEYPRGGSNIISTKISAKDFIVAKEKGVGNIWLNEQQYFANIPLSAWEFYIGGYQPAQKWLKDRRGKTLDYDDILHYQKIIVALSETKKLLREIDETKIF